MNDSHEKRANGHYLLMASAKIAAKQGYPRGEWESHPGVQEIVLKYDLRPDILTHVGAYVWSLIRH